MSSRLSTRNKVRGRGLIHPQKKYHNAIKQAQTLQAFFAISQARIFLCQHWAIEHHATISKINTMLGKIDLALAFVPSDHELNVVTKSYSVKDKVQSNLASQVELKVAIGGRGNDVLNGCMVNDEVWEVAA